MMAREIPAGCSPKKVSDLALEKSESCTVRLRGEDLHRAERAVLESLDPGEIAELEEKCWCGMRSRTEWAGWVEMGT